MVENLKEIAITAYEGIFNNQESIEIDGYRYYLEQRVVRDLDYTRSKDTAVLNRTQTRGVTGLRWHVKDTRSCG